MVRYVTGRLVSSLLTLWVIITLTFVLMHAVPGGPFDTEKALPQAILDNLNKRYHLDWPLWKQYLYYLWNLAHFDFGPSFKHIGQSVNQIIAQGFRVSATLGAMAIAVALTGGVLAGVVAALRQGRWIDHVVMTFASVGLAVPSFVVATVLVYLLAYRLKVLPAGLWGTPAQAVMPVLSLALGPMAVIARYVRTTMVEVLRQDFITTARAKGLPRRTITYVHALKNAILPVITYLGPLTAGVLTGSFVIEQIFAIPGMGREFVLSITDRDYTAIMGTTVFYSVLLIAANLAVDLVYAWVDPRIRVAKGASD